MILRNPKPGLSMAFWIQITSEICGEAKKKHLVISQFAMENPQNKYDKWRFLAGKIIYFD